MLRKKTVRDIDLKSKTVLLRVDFNVPFRPGTTEISDDSRIRASLATLRYLVERRCKVVVCSHLGRPSGRVVDDLRMAPVAKRLSDLLGSPVACAPDSVGAQVRKAADAIPPGGILMLENTRFHPEEEANDPEYASALASTAQVYVNDAFGAAHRAHASTEGVARHLPAVAGLLMARELEVLGNALQSPQRPFIAVLGGAKVSDKVGVLHNRAEKVDTIVIGGGMSATFLKARGAEVGDSLLEEGLVQTASDLLQAADDGRFLLVLPVDVVAADSFDASASCRIVTVDAIPPGWRIMDIGPETASIFEDAVKPAKTVIWNGTMGVAEWKPFAEGTRRIARALAGLVDATTIVGGGSTAEAVAALGLEDQMTHVSTGGGATLELLEGKELPGVAALMDRDS